MNKNYQLTIVKRGNGNTAETIHPIAGDKPLRLPAQADANYSLTDNATGRAPQQLHTRRRGKDLLIQIEDYRPDDSADLVLENFYELPAGTFTGLAEDGENYRFIPNTAEPTHQIAALAEGDGFTQVLGGAAYAAPPVFIAAAAPLVAVGGLGLGGMAAAGGAALLGAAALGGGGGGTGSSGAGTGGTTSGTTGGSTGGGSPGTPTPAALQAATRQGDDTGIKNDDGVTNKTQPTVVGKVDPGGKVTVKLDDGTPQDVLLTPEGNWDWTPPKALPPGKHTALITAVDAKGATATKTIIWEVDTSPLSATVAPASSMDNALKDQMLNADELKNNVPLTIALDNTPSRPLTAQDIEVVGGILVSGSFKLIDDRNYTATVAPDPKNPLTHTGKIDVSLKPAASNPITDAAGNPLAPVTQTTYYDNKPLSASIASNFAALDSSKDSKLNIAELKDGVLFNLTLDSTPNRDLSEADLVLIGGGSLKAGSFKRSSATSYEAVVLPAAATDSGTLQLKLQPEAGKALTDVAGNPCMPASSSVIDYDNKAPTASLTSNGTTLDTSKDKVLSSAESKDGVLFTITFSDTPSRPITLNDLALAGGTFKANSLIKDKDNIYTAIGLPSADTNGGQLKLSLQAPAASALTDAAGNPLASSSSETISYDTKSLSATVLSNLTDLDKNKDGVLNVSELKNGVSFKITLDSAPSRQLSASDLNWSGGTLQAGSLTKVANSDTEYTVVGLPTASTDIGKLKLSLKPPATSPLSDAAGNALTQVDSDTVAYNNKAPSVTLFTEALKDLPIDTKFSIPVSTSASDTDLSSMVASFLGQSKTLNTAALPATGWQFELTQAGLASLENGFYTFKVSTADSAGNQTEKQQVLVLDRTNPKQSSAVLTGTQTAGTSGDDLFLNSAGNQTFDGASGSDRYIWLARDAAKAGTPDRDTINNFTLGSVSGQADKLDLRDLLGGLTSSADLSKYINLKPIDTEDADSLPDSLEISISVAGLFTGSAQQDVAAVSNQVIVLKNVVPTPSTTLATLQADSNLIWAIPAVQQLFA